MVALNKAIIGGSVRRHFWMTRTQLKTAGVCWKTWCFSTASFTTFHLHTTSTVDVDGPRAFQMRRLLFDSKIKEFLDPLTVPFHLLVLHLFNPWNLLIALSLSEPWHRRHFPRRLASSWPNGEPECLVLKVISRILVLPAPHSVQGVEGDPPSQRGCVCT